MRYKLVWLYEVNREEVKKSERHLMEQEDSSGCRCKKEYRYLV